MAISWGPWEGSSPNRIRVGLDIDWTAQNGSSIDHGTNTAKATVKVYTDVEGNWSDSQTISYSGAISGSVTFQNNANNSQTLRDTKTYSRDYGNCEYGSSPVSKTFTANLSGAFNGATPSKSVTSAVPKRPYDSPANPTNVSSTRISDSSIKTTWTNKDTCGEPWDNVEVQRDGGANGAWNGTVATPWGGSTSYTDSEPIPNYAYRYRIRAQNSIGNSSWVEGDLIYTTPAAPTNAVRSGANGASQTITWTNNVSSFIDNRYEVQRSDNGGAWFTLALATTLGRDSTSFVDTTATNAAVKYKYRVQARTFGGAQGTLYSGWSNTTTETAGVTLPPNAPTNLNPTGSVLLNPTQSRAFTWQYNSADTTAQTEYQTQWRLQGAGTWTTQSSVLSSLASHTFAANTFPDNATIEWQVRTRAANATFGPWSATSVFKTVGDPNALREQRRVMRMNTETGVMETATVGVLPPIGSILAFGGASAPLGWLLCQGQSLSRTTYADLFGVIGTAYGSVDSNSFTLPNLQDRFPIGASGSKARGTTGGASTKTLVEANIPVHNHDIGHNHGRSGTDGGHAHDIDQRGGSSGNLGGATILRRGSSGTPDFSGSGIMASNGSHDHNIPTHTGSSGNAGSGTSFDVMNPWISVNYIIKT